MSTAGFRGPLAALALLLAPGAGADDAGALARPILGRAADAVITVRITSRSGISYRGSGERGESVTESTGCVIHPGGLTVLALSTFDASKRMSQSGSRGGDDMKYESEVADVTLILGDQTEVPAELVMRDADLDLAYVRPLAAAAKPFTALSLTLTGKPAMLDQVVVLDRLGVIANRTTSARIARVTAVIEKPRWAGVIEGSTASGPGAAVFTTDGGFAGMVALRSIRRDGSARGPTAMSVIVPAADILTGEIQALEVKRKPARKS